MRQRRGIDRSGKTHYNLTYVKYVNPLYPLQRGKAPNARDHLKELNNRCNSGIGYDVTGQIQCTMNMRRK